MWQENLTCADSGNFWSWNSGKRLPPMKFYANYVHNFVSNWQSIRYSDYLPMHSDSYTENQCVSVLIGTWQFPQGNVKCTHFQSLEYQWDTKSFVPRYFAPSRHCRSALVSCWLSALPASCATNQYQLRRYKNGGRLPNFLPPDILWNYEIRVLRLLNWWAFSVPSMIDHRYLCSPRR